MQHLPTKDQPRAAMSETQYANHYNSVWNYAYDVVRANAIAVGSTTRKADKARIDFLATQGIVIKKFGRSNMVTCDRAVFNAAPEVIFY